MNDDDKKQPGEPEPDEQRTVFIPADQAKGREPPAADEPTDEESDADPWGSQSEQPEEKGEPEARSEPDAGTWDAPDAEWSDAPIEPAGDEWAQDEQAPVPDEDDDRTRFEASPAGGTTGWSAPPIPSPPPPETSMPGLAAAAPRDNAQGIKVGDVLNHIFEVKRFIARGGMGEVFEGCNVNSDEKVAIKVMLPSLAADPNVISMFRREARALTRLQHEALVQYRVLAQEPQLGVLYIVTEYVDGVTLSDVLGKLDPTPDELKGLLHRLASGLRAAHALGVLHRDMSPDNVLLEDGKLTGAKIIDFGIAKDLDPGSATIIGDGFAGKLNYVAPEQLGDFGREMGPWSDVYSLGLVILAVAMRRDVQMGGTLVDAVDKRRAGPDLSPVPEQLRPVLEKMLKPNPAERLRSMDDVLRELDDRGGRFPGGADTGEPARKLSKGAMIGGGAALAVLLAGGIWMMSGGGEGEKGGSGPTAAQTAARDPAQGARQAIDAVIPSVGCSWLDIDSVSADGGQVSIKIGGVAGSPSAAQNEIASALEAAGINNANIDFGLVATISPGGCAAIDAYRQNRNTEAPRLATAQRAWEMRMQEPGRIYEGKEAANTVTEMNIGNPKLDLTLFGIDPAGVLFPMLERVNGQPVSYFSDATGTTIETVQGWEVEGSPITPKGNDSYTISIDLDHEGWQGLVLITGKGPFPRDIVQPPLGSRTTAWKQSFAQLAARQGWTADMTWFKSENQRPGD